MAYVVYERKDTRVDTPVVSITPDKRLILNAPVVRIFLERGMKSVLLLWDRSNHRLALKAAQKGDRNAYAVSIAAGSHSGSLRAKSFLDFIGWKGRVRATLPAAWNHREKMLEVTLPASQLEWIQKRPRTEVKGN